MYFRSLIGWTYRNFLKPLLFLMAPEKTHNLFVVIGKLLQKFTLTRWITHKSFAYQHPYLQQQIGTLTFANPVGLAAGFDKDVDLYQIMHDVGFGFTQVGSVTRDAYEGNPGPRAVRIPAQQALIINYGLKNIGSQTSLHKLKKHNPLPVSISIAKTNCQTNVSQQAGRNDYVQTIQLAEQLGVGDIYTLNISCPNTFGGEPFTTPELLGQLLQDIKAVHPTKPIWIKMPLELPREQFASLCTVAVQYDVQALIIANLRKQRQGLGIEQFSNIPGGISGKPTKKASTQRIFDTYQQYGQEIMLIGTGGIFSAADAYEKIKSGATLVQLITGMIYQGPQLIGAINQGLVQLLQQDGYTHISQAIGAYHR